MFRSSALRLMPPQLNERVGKWTHEPQYNLNYKKHLSNTFICTFIFSTKLFQKYIYFFAYTTKIQKHHYHIIFTLLHCYLLCCTAYHILFFTYIHTLCLTTTRWSWGHKNEELFCRFLEEERWELFWLFPESSILTPSFPRGENLLLLQHSALGVPTWHTCLVSSGASPPHSIKGPQGRGAHHNFPT
jgi:hypothetical protein